MKKFLTILFVYISIIANGQFTRPINLARYDNQTIHFGFTLGLNKMDFTVKNSGDFFNLDTVYAVENQPMMGFNLGIVSDLRLNQHWNMRFLPGLIFGQRNMEYLIMKDSSFTTKVMKIESTFLDFPLVFKYRAQRINDYRPYLLVGGSFKFDLAAQKEIKEEEKPKIRLHRSDFYYEAGFGIDYYLPYFKLSTELKFAIGIMNIIKADNTQYTTAIERLNSKMIILSFHFE